jgi:membrane glycosyltransferase
MEPDQPRRHKAHAEGVKPSELTVAPESGRDRVEERKVSWFTARRVLFVSLTALTVALISWRTFAMLQINGLDPLKTAGFLLFVILLIPITLSFWTAAIGFVVQSSGGDPLEVTRDLVEDHTNIRELPRTAVVMPVYNEDPVRVFAGLKVAYQDLEKTGRLQSFDFFVLSDTTNPDIWVREEMAFADLRGQVSDPARLIYRNRRENVDRKMGNIADFCATWGNKYRYMIVFDADSIMTGASLINLVRVMEKNPRAGIVQAPPLPVNRRTLFGRVQQFATHAYSLNFTTGLNFWQGGAANYWGHNAIIRVAPFVEHCRLPKLSGKEPLGGSILSHDFVEAAFMRRAGWKVYLAGELLGSYEEMPSSLIGYAARDRRWCQGNLQHARLLLTPGFHMVNRLHIWLGIMSYLASPLWLLLLGIATVAEINERFGQHSYFARGRALFPTWHISVEQTAVLLFSLMMMLLLLPKVLSYITQCRQRVRRGGFGGGLNLATSVICETILSSLLAPNLALLQTRFVITTLLGKNVKWDAQDRGDAETSFGEAWRRHWPSVAIGAVWAALLLATVPDLFWWFSPVFAGLLLAVPISAWTSRVHVGERARRRGLFLIPEEAQPPEILKSLRVELARASIQPWASGGDGLARVLEDQELLRVHLSMLPSPPRPKTPLQQHHYEGLKLKLRHEGLQALTVAEKRELLLEPDTIISLANHTGSGGAGRGEAGESAHDKAA